MNARQLPARPNLEQYKKQAKDLLKQSKSGDPEAARCAQPHHSVRTLADAQFVIAREHAFESWPKFAKHIAALARKHSPVSQFESAADAVVDGDVASLESLLRANPALVRARSTREHHATLLHYVSANGVEDFRQRTPPNALKIAGILLQSGAQVDALACAHGGQCTTLCLVASSVHPRRAGVQSALIELLLEHGAAIDGNCVTAALANGHLQAAEMLARRGAPLDFVAAAGLGRFELVKQLYPGAATAEIESGFMWACEYGRNEVVGFLLDSGMNIAAQDLHGQTGLHWAVIGGQLETINLLLARHAPLEVVNAYGGTVLGQARWSARHNDLKLDYAPIIELLIRAGARPNT